MAIVAWRGKLETIRPMLATLEDAPLQHEQLVYEPKYDGIRGLIEIAPGDPVPARIWSRLGNEKTRQFPDLVAALGRYSKKLKDPAVFDGEIVALDESGEPAGFSDSRIAAGRLPSSRSISCVIATKT